MYLQSSLLSRRVLAQLFTPVNFELFSLFFLVESATRFSFRFLHPQVKNKPF